MLEIHTVLCRARTMDNYSYILIDKATGISAVIDPSETKPIVDKLNELGIKPDYILNTHHHFDHTDSNLPLKELYGAKVVGNLADSFRIPGFDIGVEDGGNFMLGESKADIIDVSAHTQGHILWYFKKDQALFTGDTLFNLCIGGLFEGTPEQMFNSLQKIKKLPDDTKFYPGHEYTLGGSDYAKFKSCNKKFIYDYLQKAQENLSKGLPAGPMTLGEEKHCNPYLMASTLEEFLGTD